MPHVRRTADGRIESLHRPVEGAEFLDDEHPDVQAFVGNDGDARRISAGSTPTSCA